ncbi:hypothetical protein HNQ07_000193 [Deinococcus metalli]|uniref:Uncharacterized protein n=1 Tax=Deinococcus metalli TaxID=1141878 RepID=A0A7W8NLI2_9DEIO|nr:hypothetical protein [Deinococcus metalli]MBB5374749.1 hypothetical protein [Deinococcus metalli]GHF33991.1 hypothetical protein GCM10017781_08500 [Deinococcus metalli]
MLDSILNTVRRGAQRVQRRGEEVAHVARLRVEVFQLGRELDGLYARLGRSFHAGAEVSVLQGVRDDIKRVEDEIRARERLIEELGDPPEDEATAEASAAPTAAPVRPATPYVPPEVSPMTRTDVPTTPDPTVQHSDELPELGKDTASMGNEAAREPQRRDNALDQAENMKGHSDPLDK